MQNERGSKKLIDIIKDAIGHSHNLRKTNLKKKANMFFAPLKQGQRLTLEGANLLLRNFYYTLATIESNQINASDKSLKKFKDELVSDLGERFGISDKTVIKYIEEHGQSEDRRSFNISRELKGQEYREQITERVLEKLRENRPQYYKDVHSYFQELDPSITYATARRSFF